MSRRLSASPLELATVYCCDGCGATVTRAKSGVPEGWLAAWDSHSAEPEVQRLRRVDLCAACRLAPTRLGTRAAFAEDAGTN
jgi:hypothetical protein